MKSITNALAKSIGPSSPILRLSNGYMAHSWHIIKPDKRTLARIVRNGDLFKFKDSVFIYTRNEKWSKRFYPNLTLLRGPVRDVLRAVTRIPDSRESRIVGTYAPNDPSIIRDLVQNGFKIDDWGDRCIVYERILKK